jgi:3-oxoacyl-[acyl-carrier protein] reductase
MILKGRVALVTGAARNVGKGVALRFAREGARVIANDVNAQALSEMVDSARRDGLDIVPAVADIADGEAVARMVADAVDRFGAVDVLVNNAVIHPNRGERGPFLTVPPEGWHDFLTRNLDALYLVTSAVARIMAKNRRGSIVNISSNGAILAHRRSIPYDTLKGALEAFTRALAVDLAPWQVRVNALRPIAVAEPAPPGSDADARHRRMSEMVPLGRIARPSDVAGACVYLASDDAAFVTGQVWNIDGGMLEQSRPPQLEIDPVVRPEDIDL